MSRTQTVFVAVLLLLEALLVYFAVAQRFPFSGDDYSYLYQAKLFASGKLYAADPLYDPKLPFYECVETFCLRDFQGHRFSKYPPGWPALLAFGVWLGVPWLVNPVLGATLALLMLSYVKQRVGEEAAKATSVLLLACFFLPYYAGSFRAHIATAVFIFAAFLLHEANENRAQPSKLRLCAAGALLGCSALIRYIDWVPLAVWIGITLVRRKRLADLLLFGVAFAVPASGNLIYNALLSGDPLQVPATLYHVPISINDRLMISWKGFTVTLVRLLRLLMIFPPLLLLLVAWRGRPSAPRIKMYVVLFAMNVAVYFFYPAAAGGPGPRYFLAYFPFLVLAAAETYESFSQELPRVARPLWRVAIATLIVFNAIFVTDAAYTMYRRRDLARTVRKLGPGQNIVVLKTGTYDTAAGDLTRNPPALASADTLYFKWCDQPKLDALLKRFPGREVFVYEYPGRLYSYQPAK
jgi:hypothetical protein